MKTILKLLLFSLCANGFAQSGSQTTENLKATSEIRIRDPFVLPHKQSGTYYMYAQTRNRDVQAPAGVEVYWSSDLKHWAGPELVLELPEGFWGAKGIWAPEVHAYKGKYYLFATMHPTRGLALGFKHKGTQIFVADSPKVPFKPFANRPHLDPEWITLDGTLYVDEDGQPWMVFCHEWKQIKDGTMDLIKLKSDLSATEGRSTVLFAASESPWTAERVIKNESTYVTDGPFLYKTKTGKLIMIWSTVGKSMAYNVSMALSENGKIAGPWKHIGPPLFEQDGGHGMLFKNFEGELLLSIHQPNRGSLERLHLFHVEDAGDRLILGDEVKLP